MGQLILVTLLSCCQSLLLSRLLVNYLIIFKMNASRALVRAFTTAAPKRASNVHPGYTKIRETMKHYQVDNGLPIHLKGGITDKLLFWTTIALNGIGIGMCLEFFYDASFPKKAD